MLSQSSNVMAYKNHRIGPLAMINPRLVGHQKVTYTQTTCCAQYQSIFVLSAPVAITAKHNALPYRWWVISKTKDTGR